MQHHGRRGRDAAYELQNDGAWRNPWQTPCAGEGVARSGLAKRREEQGTKELWWIFTTAGSRMASHGGEDERQGERALLEDFLELSSVDIRKKTCT